MNNAADRGDRPPRVERIVLRTAVLLLHMTVIVGAWQFRHAGRSRYRSIAALSLSVIRLLAGALGMVMHAWQHPPAAEMGANAVSMQRAIPES
jgi:hypothetical protein